MGYNDRIQKTGQGGKKMQKMADSSWPIASGKRFKMFNGQ
jgi:hypothetical protein